MNYIKEINAFYDRLEQEPLTVSAITLWYALMHINNKAGWSVEFSVSGPVLRLKAALPETTFKRARKELVDKGYIVYRTRGRNRAPIYRMKQLSNKYTADGRLQKESSASLKEETSAMKNIQVEDGSDRRSLSEERVSAIEKQKSHQEETAQEGCHSNRNWIATQSTEANHAGGDHHEVFGEKSDHQADRQTTGTVAHQSAQQTDRKAAPLYKQNKTKSNETKADALVFYQENFGVMSPFLMEEMLYWVEDVGDALVIEAMKRALMRGKANFGYVRGILQAWMRKGIRTIAQVEAEEIAFQNEQREREFRIGRRTSERMQEIVPEWFLERKRAEKEKKKRMEEEQAETIDVGELLRKYREGG